MVGVAAALVERRAHGVGDGCFDVVHDSGDSDLCTGLTATAVSAVSNSTDVLSMAPTGIPTAGSSGLGPTSVGVGYGATGRRPIESPGWASGRRREALVRIHPRLPVSPHESS